MDLDMLPVRVIYRRALAAAGLVGANAVAVLVNGANGNWFFVALSIFSIVGVTAYVMHSVRYLDRLLEGVDAAPPIAGQGGDRAD